MSLRSLVVDFNSYFASVEQELRPELRGKPVAVVPVMADTTSCIAASYEAKEFKVKTGTRVSDARRMCPGLVVLEAQPATYVEYHHRLVTAVESCIHVEEVWSIDEMVCELTGKLKERENALALAQKIKRTIAKEVGTWLRSSIGIAPNPFLAKTASDMQKPNGLVVIEQEDLPGCLHRLELRDLCGIGKNMEERLHAQGIRTVEALCAAGRETLRKAWNGIEGERMHQALRGETVYRPPTRHSTIGHSHVLPPRERNAENALAVLHRLLQKAAMRLRKAECFAGGMQLFVKEDNGCKTSDEVHFLETQDTVELNHALGQLWSRRAPGGGRPMLVGVTLFRLVEEVNVTPALFGGQKARRELNKLVDRLNERYGKNTVYFGGAHAARQAAPMRIAFDHVPDLDTEGD
jgi:DNA polymerase-4